MKTATKFSPEVRERVVPQVREHQCEHTLQWTTIQSVAGKIGCTAETLRRWVRETEHDLGEREGLTAAERGADQSVGTQSLSENYV